MPSKLDEIRQKYPQYNDMSDADLANRLYSKFYSDMPRAEFDRKVGLPPVDPMLPLAGSAAQEQAKDIGRGVVRGGVRGLEYSTGAVPSLLGELGPYFNTPEEEAQREHLGKQIEAARATAGSPSSFVGKYVDQPTTKPGQYAETIATGLATAPLQPGGPLTKAVTTIGGGVGAQTGADVAGALGLDETAGSVIGGVVGGGGAGASAAATAAARARRLLPTSAANRAAAKNAIDMISQAGLVIEPAEAHNFATGLRADLDRALFSSDPAGRGRVGFHAADLIERTNGDLATILNVHGSLGQVRPEEGANYAAAMHTREAIRDWIGNLQPNQVVRGDPQYVSGLWQHHRDTWRVHSNLEEIEEALQSAEWRRMVSGRGTNLNTIRQEIRKILDNDNMARRYTPEARNYMERVVEGDLARNSLRRLAAFAPHGPVSSAPALFAIAMGHADAGATLAGTAFLAHFFQHRLEERSLNQLLDIIRTGSPLHTPPQRAARARLLIPRTAPASVRGALQAGAESPLAEQPEPVAEPGP